MATPSPLRTILALVKGYLPRVVQGRGWVLAALAMAPVGLALLFQLALALAQKTEGVSVTAALDLFHGVLVRVMLPVMALVAAPAGIREDLEQRTLPLFLTRPVAVWSMPFAKGLLWYVWGGVWLMVAAGGLLVLGADLDTAVAMGLALICAYWAQLAFMTLLGLVFKRGTLWGAIFLFLWDPLVRILPNNLQRVTFLHYTESIAGSRGTDVSTVQLLAQEQISTPLGIAILVLLGLGLLCWALAGWKLQVTPIGLAGADAEG
jgi:hypothetical protein